MKKTVNVKLKTHVKIGEKVKVISGKEKGKIYHFFIFIYFYITLSKQLSFLLTSPINSIRRKNSFVIVTKSIARLW